MKKILFPEIERGIWYKYGKGRYIKLNDIIEYKHDDNTFYEYVFKGTIVWVHPELVDIRKNSTISTENKKGLPGLIKENPPKEDILKFIDNNL